MVMYHGITPLLKTMQNMTIHMMMLRALNRRFGLESAYPMVIMTSSETMVPMTERRMEIQKEWKNFQSPIISE